MDLLIESSIEMTDKIHREHSLVVDANMIVEMLEETLEAEKCGLPQAVRLVFRRLTNYDYDNPAMPVQVSPPHFHENNSSFNELSDVSYFSEQDDSVFSSLTYQTEDSSRDSMSSEQEIENLSEIIPQVETRPAADLDVTEPERDQQVRPMKRPLESEHGPNSPEQNDIDILDMANVWEGDDVPQKIRITDVNKPEEDQINEFDVNGAATRDLPQYTNVSFPSTYDMERVTPPPAHSNAAFPLLQHTRPLNIPPMVNIPNPQTLFPTNIPYGNPYSPPHVKINVSNNREFCNLDPLTALRDMDDGMRNLNPQVTHPFNQLTFNQYEMRIPTNHVRSSTVTLNTLRNENLENNDNVEVEGLVNNENLGEALSNDNAGGSVNNEIVGGGSLNPPENERTTDSDNGVSIVVEGAEELKMENWHRHLGKLIVMFPDADTSYLNRMCIDADSKVLGLDDIVDKLLQDGYPLRKKEEKPNEVEEENNKNLSWEELSNYLTEVLPNADPSYLEQECEKLAGNQEQLLQFVADRLERKDYPKKEEYLKRLETQNKVKFYKENFSVEEFLKIFPDPITYFYKEKRTGYPHKDHSLAYLKQKLRDVRCNDIKHAYIISNNSLTRAYHDLVKKRKDNPDFKMRSSRSAGVTHMPPGCSIPFYQEVAFLEHEEVIKEYLAKRKREKELAFKTAKENGELLECGVCFDNEVLPMDASTCTEGHIFCKSCIKTGVETDIGAGKTTFICFDQDCSGEFDLKILQLVLDAVVFSRMLLRRQAEEVKAAGIEDLETCPFCEFCTIPDPEDKIFKCLNPECLKESCRKCREPNHVPLRCEEVEKPQDVKARTYIEDQMTQALVRECWKCHQKFIKEDGCNKMTCRCGAKMCYLCRQPVKDYSHFNGQGGSEFQKCPLYSDNKALHIDAVKEAGKLAKETMVNENPNVNIMHDPTAIFPATTAKAASTRNNNNNNNRINIHNNNQNNGNIVEMLIEHGGVAIVHIGRGNRPAIPPRRRRRRPG